MKHFLFLHIPKAGGSTLRTILQRQFRGKKVYLIGADIYGDIQRFSQLDSLKAQSYSLVMGHMRFGLHDQFNDRFCYLTLLREPVSRVISEYRFLKTNQHHTLNQRVAQMSFEQYLKSGITDQISNGQVRLISNAEARDHQGNPIIREMTQDDYQLALNNIERYFPQVGFIERYDESLMLWQGAFNWRFPLYVKENVTLKTPDLSPIKPKQRALAAQLNQWDIQLYNTLLATFDQRIAKLGPGFKIKLSLFKLINHLYNRYVHLQKGE